MKYIPEQDWRDKIAAINRLASNFRPKAVAQRYEPAPLTDEVREHVESVTRFERGPRGILKQNWRRPRHARA
jgi:hypothetical protein